MIDDLQNDKDPWYVGAIDSNQSNAKVPHITFYDPSNYDYKIGVDVAEIKAKHEILSHLNQNNQVNNLKLERVILHEAICNISLNYQVTDKTLPDLALKVQESALKIANSMKDNVQWSNYADTKYLVTRYIAGDLKSDSPEYIALKDLEKRFDELLKKHQDGKIKLYNQKDPNYFTNNNKKNILTDMYYNIQQQELKDRLVEKAVQKAVDEIEDFKQLKKLTYHESNTRKACLVVGGAACGKGSVTLMVERFIMENDQVEINPDNYKSIIMPYNKIDGKKYDVGHTKLMHGSITHIESSQIFDRILYRWQKLSQNGKAPNLLLDVARASKWAIGLAQTGGTKVEIHAATLNTETALKRSYKRGEETGRFMPTEDLLKGHKDQLSMQIAAISESKDAANLFVYDTEVIFKTPPELFLISNSTDKSISILNCKCLIGYLQKHDINTKGCNSKNIYEGKLSIKDSFKMLIKGFDVSFYSDGGEEKIFTIPKEGDRIIVDNENLFKTTYLKDERFKEVVESAKSLGYSFGENLDKFFIDINQESIKVSSNTASYVPPKNQPSNQGRSI